MRRGLSEPAFCGDLVCGLRRIIGSGDFSAQFVGVVSHYKKVGCGIGVLQRAACLVVGPVTVGGFAFLFDCARGSGFGLCGKSDLGTYLLVGWWGPGALAVCGAHRGSPVGFLLLWCSV